MSKLNEWGPMTVLMIVVVVIVAGVGGAVVIVEPATLSFDDYLERMQKLAYALAGLGVGRGILAAGNRTAEASVQAAAIASTTGPVDSAAPIDEDLELDDELAIADDLDDDELPDPVDVKPSAERLP